jgi:integrase
LLLALQTGCRLQSELLPLVWDDLDKARLTIPAGRAKAGKPRHLPLSQDMVSALRAMPATATGRYVFPVRRGGYYFRFNTHFYAAARRAGSRARGSTSTASDIHGPAG